LLKINLPLETEITDIYLHFTKLSVNFQKHMTTFRAQNNNRVQIIQFIYAKSLDHNTKEEIIMESFTYLDNSASNLKYIYFLRISRI